jgi:hypothetical protein
VKGKSLHQFTVLTAEGEGAGVQGRGWRMSILKAMMSPWMLTRFHISIYYTRLFRKFILLRSPKHWLSLIVWIASSSPPPLLSPRDVVLERKGDRLYDCHRITSCSNGVQSSFKVTSCSNLKLQSLVTKPHRSTVRCRDSREACEMGS